MSPAQAFDQMVADHNGQPWEVEDASNLDQCFDLAEGYLDYLGVPRAAISQHLYAKDIFLQPYDLTRQYFDIIPNSPDFIPQKGDIGVYDSTVGVAGHVAVEAGGGNTVNHTSFDQNWNGQYAHFVNHSYNGFLGVLRLKGTGGDMPTVTNPDQVRDLYATLTTVTNPTQQQINDWVGKPWDQAFYGIYNSVAGADLVKQNNANTSEAHINADQVNALYQSFTGRDATAQEKKDWTGKYWHDAIFGIYNSKPADDYRKAQAIPPASGLDQATKDQITETNSIVKQIRDWLKNIFNIK